MQSHPWSDCASLLAEEFDIFDQPFYNALLCQPAVSWSEFHHDLLLIHDALARSASWQLQALCWASASTSKTRQPPARYQNAPSTTQTTSKYLLNVTIIELVSQPWYGTANMFSELKNLRYCIVNRYSLKYHCSSYFADTTTAKRASRESRRAIKL